MEEKESCEDKGIYWDYYCSQSAQYTPKKKSSKQLSIKSCNAKDKAISLNIFFHGTPLINTSSKETRSSKKKNSINNDKIFQSKNKEKKNK